MAYRKDIVSSREDLFDETGVKNPWNWHWLDRTHLNRRIGEVIRKLQTPGMAYCTLCRKEINYRSRGVLALDQHVKTAIHADKISRQSNNPTLPGNPLTSQASYGIHPTLESSVCVQPEEDRRVPLDDRVKHQEAMLLGFLAQNNMPLSMSSQLIEFSKELSRDKEALNKLCMDRTTASYKLKYGLSKTMEDALLEKLRSSPFSLNIDEAMNSNKQKVLGILVNTYCEEKGETVLNHLASLELVKVTSELLFEALDNLFSQKDIPWSNLISVMMDSCNVMRGSKGGFEKLIRDRRAPHLLDIDGDTCHHAHNAAKAFCAPFKYHVENLLRDLHNDFRWSPEHREYLSDICKLLGTAPTCPEQYIPHRWLSVLNVSLDTLRLLDAYTIFYSSYLQPATKKLYLDYIKSAQSSISSKGKEELKTIKQNIASKVGSLTKEGKERKARITEKVFTERPQTMLILNFYTAILPLLEKYVTVFQSKECRIQELHSQQQQLLRNFLLCFVKPDVIPLSAMKLKQFVVTPDTHLPGNLRFYGNKAKTLLCSRSKDDTIRQEFESRASQAFVRCAGVLLSKMPLTNPALRAFSVLDPKVRGTTACLHHLSLLPSLLPSVVVHEQKDDFDLEIRKYQLDSSLPTADHKIDKWWSLVDAKQYPLLSRVAKVAMTCFHGPVIESTFSIMGLIIDKNSTQIDLETYAAFQTVRYGLQASKQSAVAYFSKKDPQKDPVDKNLTRNMRQAWRLNEDRKAAIRKQAEAIQTDKGLATSKTSKRQGNDQLKSSASLNRPDVAKQATDQAAMVTKRPASATSEPPPAKRHCSHSVPDKTGVQITVKSNNNPQKMKQMSLSGFFRQK